KVIDDGKIAAPGLI
ncbi:hypothetical protein J002_03142, partial [Cryptococcus neoformans]